MDISVTQTPIGFYAIDRNTYDVDCDHTGFFCTDHVDLLDKKEEG